MEFAENTAEQLGIDSTRIAETERIISSIVALATAMPAARHLRQILLKLGKQRMDQSDKLSIYQHLECPPGGALSFLI